MRVPVGSTAIEIIQGDIAAQDTDAVVNAANNHLWMGAGVAGAIKRAGGESIEEEAVAKGPIAVGSAIATTGGALKAKYVIHAAVMGQDLHTNADYIRSAIKATFALAESMKLTSISVPALGTGVGGFSMNHCANILIGEAVQFLLHAHSVKLIRFVLFGEDARKVFEEEVRLAFSARRVQ